MLQMISFGTILDNFGSNVARKVLLVLKQALEPQMTTHRVLEAGSKASPGEPNRVLEAGSNHPFGMTFGA